MTRKHRNHRIAISLALGGALFLFVIQTPCQYQNKPPTVELEAGSNIFLPADTQSASNVKREQQKVDQQVEQQDNAQEVNVKQIRRMRATAYDLGINSCGKRYGHPARGIAASGANLNGLSREKAMIVSSVDFPLGTKLSVVFPESYEHYNGIYVVGDTGNLKSGTLDVFVGDFGEATSQEAINFGVRTVDVVVLK